MDGIFRLKTAADLREKLRRDLQKLKDAPLDLDAAFNFFVTAESILDWAYPKRANKQKRIDVMNGSALLWVCSHLATGAKHFEPEAHHHVSVSSTEKGGGYWGSYFWASNFWVVSYQYCTFDGHFVPLSHF